MTEEDYLNGFTGSVKDRAEGKEVLERYLQSFEMVLTDISTMNTSLEQWEYIVNEMKKNKDVVKATVF